MSFIKLTKEEKGLKTTKQIWRMYKRKITAFKKSGLVNPFNLKKFHRN